MKLNPRHYRYKYHIPHAIGVFDPSENRYQAIELC